MLGASEGKAPPVCLAIYATYEIKIEFVRFNQYDPCVDVVLFNNHKMMKSVSVDAMSNESILFFIIFEACQFVD